MGLDRYHSLPGNSLQKNGAVSDTLSTPLVDSHMMEEDKSLGDFNRISARFFQDPANPLTKQSSTPLSVELTEKNSKEDNFKQDLRALSIEVKI